MILTINNISKQYGRINAVDDLSLNIREGSVHGILGPNGSGKTTLLGIVLNVIQPNSGTYQWFDNSPLQVAHKRIGALLEYPNFYHYMSGYDNLEIAALIKGKGRLQISAVLDKVGLLSRQHDKFSNYSLGMKQRLALASCLINDPDVLVLDEPTNGLDPQGISEVRALVNDIAAKGTTIIIASHLLDEVEKVCTDVTILKNGKSVFSGPVSGLGSDQAVLEIAANNMEQLFEVLNENPSLTSVKREGKIISVVCTGNYSLDDLNRDLAKRDIYLKHIEIKKKNLEKNFMELLRK